MFDANEFIKYFAALVAVLNPVAAAPISLGFTPGGTLRDRIHLATLASITVLVVLSVAAWLGEEILDLFAISVDVFRMAGGLLILLTALSMVRGSPVKATAERSDFTAAIVPLGDSAARRSGRNRHHHRLRQSSPSAVELVCGSWRGHSRRRNRDLPLPRRRLRPSASPG